MRLLFITDFTEQFAYRFLSGILDYARTTEQWVICKMPPSYKRQLGMEGVVAWAKEWHADVVTLFRKNGIVALAQDYIVKFDAIPNITGDYALTHVQTTVMSERILRAISLPAFSARHRIWARRQLSL